MVVVFSLATPKIINSKQKKCCWTCCSGINIVLERIRTSSISGCGFKSQTHKQPTLSPIGKKFIYLGDIFFRFRNHQFVIQQHAHKHEPLQFQGAATKWPSSLATVAPSGGHAQFVAGLVKEQGRKYRTAKLDLNWHDGVAKAILIRFAARI